MSTSPEVEARLREFQAERRSVLMDLSRLEFMDSSGLAVMLRAINASGIDGWAFEIDPDVSPQVRRLFRLAAVDQFARIDGHESSAA